MGSYVKVFEVLAVVVVLIASASAGGPKFANDFTIIVNFTRQIISPSQGVYEQLLDHGSQIVYSNTIIKKLRSDFTAFTLISNKKSTLKTYQLIDFTAKKIWIIIGEEGKPPGKCMEYSYEGPIIHFLDFSAFEIKSIGKVPGVAGFMFDTWVSDPYAHNDNKSLNYTILTTFNDKPASLRIFQDTFFGGYTFKGYDPTPPNPDIFKLPPSCKNNTVILNKEYKREADPFKYSFLRMNDFFQF